MPPICPKLLWPKLLGCPNVDLPNCVPPLPVPVATELGAPHGDCLLPMFDVPPKAGVLGVPNEDCPKAGVFCAGALGVFPKVPKGDVELGICCAGLVGCAWLEVDGCCCCFGCSSDLGPPAAIRSG